MAAKGGEQSEIIRVRYKHPNHLGGDMAGLEYFILFWQPILGLQCSALYELLWMSVSSHCRGNSMLTRREVADILGLSDLTQVIPLIHHLKLVGLVEQGEGELLLINPLPRITNKMYDELSPALQALHDRYAQRMGMDLRVKGPEYVQPFMLPDVAPPPPPTVAHERSVTTDAPKLVEFFRKTLVERLKGKDFVFRGNERAMNIRIANSMLRNYTYEECCEIIKKYLSDDYRAQRCASLKPISRNAGLYLNRIKGMIPDETPKARGRSSRILNQGDIGSYGTEEWA
jgi:hypothetical protein